MTKDETKRFRLLEEENRRLKQLGHEPTDVDYLLMSHLHLDHAGRRSSGRTPTQGPVQQGEHDGDGARGEAFSSCARTGPQGAQASLTRDLGDERVRVPARFG